MIELPRGNKFKIRLAQIAHSTSHAGYALCCCVILFVCSLFNDADSNADCIYWITLWSLRSWMKWVLGLNILLEHPRYLVQKTGVSSLPFPNGIFRARMWTF
jgi:hypothetical protein